VNLPLAAAGRKFNSKNWENDAIFPIINFFEIGN